MTTVSSYKADTIITVLVIAGVSWMSYHHTELITIVLCLAIGLGPTLFTARKFIADDEGISVEGPLFLFKKPLSIRYADIIEVRCGFWSGAPGSNSIRFLVRGGEEMSITHSIPRKRFTPLLTLLAGHAIPIIIHDVKNDDLLK